MPDLNLLRGQTTTGLYQQPPNYAFSSLDAIPIGIPLILHGWIISVGGFVSYNDPMYGFEGIGPDPITSLGPAFVASSDSPNGFSVSVTGPTVISGVTYYSFTVGVPLLQTANETAAWIEYPLDVNNFNVYSCVGITPYGSGDPSAFIWQLAPAAAIIIVPPMLSGPTLSCGQTSGTLTWVGGSTDFNSEFTLYQDGVQVYYGPVMPYNFSGLNINQMYTFNVVSQHTGYSSNDIVLTPFACPMATDCLGSGPVFTTLPL